MDEKTAGKIITTENGVNFSVVNMGVNTVALVIVSELGVMSLNIDKASAALIADEIKVLTGKAVSAGEKLYYLELHNEDNNDNFINLRKNTREVMISDKRQTSAVQTQFTLQEIYDNEKLRKYVHFIVPVK